MRRKDREVTSIEEILDILRGCTVCRIAMIDDGSPYVVPLNFGAELCNGKIVLYFHCAKEGRKLDVLRKDPRICFEADCEHSLIEAEKACGYGYTFASVIGEGRVQLLENPLEKAHGLTVLMKHQTGKQFTFTEAEASAAAVLRVRLDTLSGKRHAG